MEKDNLLSLLIENKEEKYTIRKLALLRKINYKSAYLALRGLEQEKLAALEKIGNSTICRFTGNFSSRVYAVEHSRREKLLQNKNFLVLYNRLKKITLPFIVILFGSWAKKTAKKNSDIDLLVISEHHEVENALRLV
ncbi:MAG: nucleotidyltransferase domain-containing protein, partial [Nanoarchaeota archaeon]